MEATKGTKTSKKKACSVVQSPRIPAPQGLAHETNHLETPPRDEFGDIEDLENTGSICGAPSVISINHQGLFDFDSFDMSMPDADWHLPSPITLDLFVHDTLDSKVQWPCFDDASPRLHNLPLQATDESQFLLDGVTVCESSEPLNSLSGEEEISNDSRTRQSCLCQQRALSLLETLALEAHSSKTYTISDTLQSKKETLQQCALILDCNSCNRVSTFIILLIQICQKAIDSYVKLARALRDFKQQLQNLTALNAVSLVLGGYDVTSEEEACVLSSLTSLQLGKWKLFLGRLSKQCESVELKAHLALATDSEREVQMQIHDVNL